MEKQRRVKTNPTNSPKTWKNEVSSEQCAAIRLFKESTTAVINTIATITCHREETLGSAGADPGSMISSDLSPPSLGYSIY
jgi:hypothetical protein